MSDPRTGLRASDADREATVKRLHTAAMEGRLDPEELEQRVSAAYAAKHCTELEPLTADVTPPSAAPPPSPPAPPVFVQPGIRTNGLAITSLICGLVWFAWLGSAVAIITGHIALRQIAESGGRQTGRGLAIAGLALGYLGALTLVLTVLGAIVG